jgi:hypothetical protein
MLKVTDPALAVVGSSAMLKSFSVTLTEPPLELPPLSSLLQAAPSSSNDAASEHTVSERETLRVISSPFSEPSRAILSQPRPPTYPVGAG